MILQTVLVKEIPLHIKLITGDALKSIPLIGDYKESDYVFSLEIPHFIQLHKKWATLIVMPDFELNAGDEIKTEYSGNNKGVIITQIVERRKARGDWSKNVYCQNPDFVEVNFE